MSEEVPERAEHVENAEYAEGTEQADEKQVGVQGRTQRDMQNVTELVEERTTLDIRSIERAVDKLVKIREMDKKTERPFVPKNKLVAADVQYFMEKTGEDKGKSEQFLDAADGNLQNAFVSWLKTNPGSDFDSRYGYPQINGYSAPYYYDGAYSQEVSGTEWQWPLDSAMNARPVRDTRQGVMRPIPPMQMDQQVVGSTRMGPYVPEAPQTRIIRRRRPRSYRPFVPLTPQRRQGWRTPPAVQQLNSCPFDPLYKHLLVMLNSYRRQMRQPPLCMNEKLMRAAKLQSDFQALAKVPTHAGPRESNLGSLEDRLRWMKFSTPSRRTPVNTRPEAEELIYYWPSRPRDQNTMLRLLRGAMRAWQQDGQARAVMTNSRFQFFGFGLTRARGGMYLTVVLAGSRSEVCNLCPEDGQSPAYNPPRDRDTYPPKPFDEDGCGSNYGYPY
ncbi:hypothetical protein PSACC_02654 [Paramicrosporidium saccamoebae]|uniref:SCP domain-containing protein n=1 Tax=Paramicrosporidium saccamoebae TaxID=1246581 RepID=A0A2H9TIH9_9FUNG|nr:hypothetical protein PSACC_02654 [Paramicrosporidium saccamoebae]